MDKFKLISHWNYIFLWTGFSSSTWGHYFSFRVTPSWFNLLKTTLPNKRLTEQQIQAFSSRHEHKQSFHASPGKSGFICVSFMQPGNKAQLATRLFIKLLYKRVSERDKILTSYFSKIHSHACAWSSISFVDPATKLWRNEWSSNNCSALL